MTYSPDVFDAICDLIAVGQSVNHILSSDDMPSRETFYKWIREDSSKADKYARAKEAQADYFCDEILDIADNSLNDWVERENAKTGEKYIALNNEALERSKIRIEARKWTMGKNKPKKYGDKQQIDVESPNGTMSPKEMDDKELARRVGFMIQGLLNK